jgi:hypothetical protein
VFVSFFFWAGLSVCAMLISLVEGCFFLVFRIERRGWKWDGRLRHHHSPTNSNSEIELEITCTKINHSWQFFKKNPLGTVNYNHG